MAIIKRDVESFINKVEQKAKDSVKKRYQELIDQECHNIVDSNPELKELIYQAQLGLDKFYENSQKVIESVKSLGVSLRNNNYHIGLEDKLNDVRVWVKGEGDEESYYKPADVLTEAFLTHMPDAGNLKELLDNKDREIKEVEANYYALRTHINRLPSAKRQVEYLDSIGFDTTWIITTQDILPRVDASKLFPCGEKS